MFSRETLMDDRLVVAPFPQLALTGSVVVMNGEIQFERDVERLCEV